MIKLCVDPHCDAIFHNIPRAVTRCSDCNGRIIIINEETYRKKFQYNWFQYDYHTGEYYRPLAKETQLKIEL